MLWEQCWPVTHCNTLQDCGIYHSLSVSSSVDGIVILYNQLERFKTTVSQTPWYCIQLVEIVADRWSNQAGFASGTRAWFRSLVTCQSLLVTYGSCSSLLLFSYSQQVSDTLSLHPIFPKSFPYFICVGVFFLGWELHCTVYTVWQKQMESRGKVMDWGRDWFHSSHALLPSQSLSGCL